MKKATIIFLAIAFELIIFCIGIKVLYATGTIYSKTCIVTEIDTENDLVTVSTATGLLFQFHGVEDNDIGDLLSVTFFTCFSKYVTDDVILAYRYSGFTDLFVEIEEGR